MSESLSPDNQLIHDKAIAWDAAHAEKPYRELEIGAREAGFGHIAASMAIRASLASDMVVSEARNESPVHSENLGNPEGPIGIRFRTFEQAQIARKELSDGFIDGAMSNTLAVGDRHVGIKSYLDTVEQTDRDAELLSDPSRVAGLYESTTDMIARNLRVKVDSRLGDAVRGAVSKQGQLFLEKFLEARSSVPQAVIRLIKGKDKYLSDETIQGLEYRGLGLTVDGKDVLDMAAQIDGVRSNIRVQRGEADPPFIMAYTDARIRHKMEGRADELGKRICINPDFEATPQIFEQIYQIANKAGISLQLKMFQRTPEAADASRAKAKTDERRGLRGDGILVYVDDEHADAVLETVLALAEQNADSFKGRRTSRIYQNVADGIGVGDEPIGQEDSSLTGHRANLLEKAKVETLASGKTGNDARKLFRDSLAREARASGVNPDNVAFNMVA